MRRSSFACGAFCLRREQPEPGAENFTRSAFCLRRELPVPGTKESHEVKTDLSAEKWLIMKAVASGDFLMFMDSYGHGIGGKSESRSEELKFRC